MNMYGRGEEELGRRYIVMALLGRMLYSDDQ